MVRSAAIAGFVFLAGTAVAQDGQPLSAIDWLSHSVQPATMAYTPYPGSQPATTSPDGAAEETVTVTSLDASSPDAVGILSPAVSGLPDTLWSSSSESTAAALVLAAPEESLPAVQDLLVMLLLAEAKPPVDSTPEGRLFLARVDKLLEMGALQQAQSLLEAADTGQPRLFRRWFDISLLTGTEDKACETMRDAPDIAPTYAVRIFCIARGGDWETAALILNTGIALGDITADEEALLVRFLETEFDDAALPLPAPDPVTPLEFRLFEAIGEPLATAQLPRAFANADLRNVVSWRQQLEAAERLGRFGAVDDNVIRSLYLANRPAASGGIWDRAEAMQRFDTAIKARDPNAVASTLPTVYAALAEARLEVPFARLYAPELAELPLTGDAGDLAFRVQLLSRRYEEAAISYIPHSTSDAFLIAIARGSAETVVPETDREKIVHEAFTGTATLPIQITQLLSQQQLGEALLQAIKLFSDGMTGDPHQITTALTTFRAVGLEDVARRASLQYLILDRRT